MQRRSKKPVPTRVAVPILCAVLSLMDFGANTARAQATVAGEPFILVYADRTRMVLVQRGAEGLGIGGGSVTRLSLNT